MAYGLGAEASIGAPVPETTWRPKPAFAINEGPGASSKLGAVVAAGVTGGFVAGVRADIRRGRRGLSSGGKGLLSMGALFL